MSTDAGHSTQKPQLNQKKSAGWGWPRLAKSEAVAPAVSGPSVRPSSIYSYKSSNDITSSDPNLQPPSTVSSELVLPPLPAIFERSVPGPPSSASSIHGSVTSGANSRPLYTQKPIHQPEVVEPPFMASSIHGSIHPSLDPQPPQIPAPVHEPEDIELGSTGPSIHGLTRNSKETKPPHTPQPMQQPTIVRPPSVTSSRRGSMDGSIDGSRSVHIIQIMHRSSISKAPSVLESLHEPGEMDLPPLPESPYMPSITDFPQVVGSRSGIFDTSPPDSPAAPRMSVSDLPEARNLPVVTPIAIDAPGAFPEVPEEDLESTKAKAELPSKPPKRVSLAASATLPPPKIMILRATEDDGVSGEPLARYPAQSGFESTYSTSVKPSRSPAVSQSSNTASMDHLPKTTQNYQNPSTQRVRKRKLLVRKTRRALLRGPVLKALLGRELASQTQPVLKMMATGGDTEVEGNGRMEIDGAGTVR